MVYITVPQTPLYRQITLEELLFQSYNEGIMLNANTTNTKTYVYESTSEHFTKTIDVPWLIQKLYTFNNNVASLRNAERSTLYTTFYIPKRSGGLRRIDAPKQELMEALRKLKNIFEDDFHLLYHTSSFAYVKGRSTIDAIKRHQNNESKWFGKFDLANFFGSTTLEFLMQQLSSIFPFSEIVKIPNGREELSRALKLAFLNGGLPQGTPLSPLITNVMMIPIDYKLANGLRSFEKQNFIYTRYADDFIISSKYDFDISEVERFITDILVEFNAPFSIKREKTRYGSSAGRNWNLGVMLNKDNEITIGHKKKKQFQSMLYNYITDKRNNKSWNLQDVQVMNGLRSYYYMVEPTAITNIIKHIDEKMNTNVIGLIKEDLQKL